MSFDLSVFQYHPVVHLPQGYEVYDFTQGYDPGRTRKSPYGVGRYNERRPGMYSTQLFVDTPAPRDIHVGIDLAAPVGTPVHAFFAGRIHLAGINSTPGDYGGTVLTEHSIGGRVIWALHGHLSHHSVATRQPGEEFQAGEIIGWIGDESENGGWNPHLHFQLSWERPERPDLPGAVNERDLVRALEIYPDPRLVLGPLY